MCGETTPGPVMTWVLIIALTGVVSPGPHGRGLKRAALLHEGTAAPDCTPGTWNPVNFTVLQPSGWTRGRKISIRTDGKSLDPGTRMHLKLVTVTHESSSHQVFHSFYEEMRSDFPISAKAKNLFLSLAESVAQTLNATSCYVWGGPTWETIGLGKQGSCIPRRLLMRLPSQNTGKVSGS
jgi:hypothetical protein